MYIQKYLYKMSKMKYVKIKNIKMKHKFCLDFILFVIFIKIHVLLIINN